MTNTESTICLFKDLDKTLDVISNEDAGVLIKALFAHANGREPEGLEESPVARALYVGVADQMDRLADFRNKKAENRKKREETVTNGNKPEQTVTNENKTEQTGYPYPYPNPSSPIGEKREAPTEPREKAQKRFVPPTVEEVKAYVEEKKLHVDPDRFVSFYASKNWYVGKNKMVDWKAAIRGWSSRDKPVEVKPAREKIDYSAITRDLFVNELKGATG